MNYILDIPALLFWAELSRGILRRFIQGLAVLASAIAVAGLAAFLFGKSPYLFMRYNSLIAIFSMLVIGGLALVPGITRKHLMIETRVLRFVMPAVAFLVLYVNVKWFFGTPPPPHLEPITFAIWISAIGYEAAKHIFDNERRLFSIEGELEAARQIQASILPETVPQIVGLRIAAAYKPMSTVAGDFYQFLKVDSHHIGVLVADVTGHGVPAALIASMIKVAMQSALPSASNPGQLIAGLNRILTPELSGRLTSAAYLWIDTDTGTAQYSAAGHPPLMQWKAANRELLSIESNGLLFGITADADFPVQTMRLEPGDRFLLCTDGLAEPENTRGEAFGEHQIERLFSLSAHVPATALSSQLLWALAAWRPASIPQQDDITLVLIDVL